MSRNIPNSCTLYSFYLAQTVQFRKTNELLPANAGALIYILKTPFTFKNDTLVEIQDR